VLFVGTLCFRKGLWDLASVASGLGTERFEFRFVGPHMSEARQSIADLQGLVTFPGKQPQASLPEAYAWGDVFVFPTIEDGYAVVLAQAAAAGLPILTTSNCSGPDLLRDGESGWVVPIRSPHVIADRLRWAEVHRTEVAAMADRVYDRFQPRDWVDVARDFEQLCLDHIGKVRAERRNERRDR
jgi:glycosyltransferase involved in cell wall biosynthesis